MKDLTRQQGFPQKLCEKLDLRPDQEGSSSWRESSLRTEGDKKYSKMFATACRILPA